MDEPPTTSAEGTGLPGLCGVDHIGITVPDMEQATAFFVDVLGCELLYEREPPGDDSPRDRLGVPAGSRIQGVRFLRCANGANIELFEFSSPEQREDFPRPSDVGIQHLALYVDDLDAAVEHLRRHGVKLMSGPNPLPGPEAGEGNRFIYARTPWGLTVELISYPAPMAYEQHSDARRWRPTPTDRWTRTLLYSPSCLEGWAARKPVCTTLPNILLQLGFLASRQFLRVGTITRSCGSA